MAPISAKEREAKRRWRLDAGRQLQEFAKTTMMEREMDVAVGTTMRSFYETI